MNVLVAVKQIVDIAAPLQITKDRRGVATTDRTEYRINEYDLYAIEQALRLREDAGQGVVDLITVGPERSVAALRRGMGMGADGAIFVECDSYMADNAKGVANFIAKVLQSRKYRLVLTGVMSEDAMQGAVGPMIAMMMNMPCVTNVVDISFGKTLYELNLLRELEGGVQQRITSREPMVATIQSGPVRPRYPSLSNMLRANSAPIATAKAECQVADNWRLSPPAPFSKVEMLEGSIEDKAGRLAKKLRERNLVRQ